jgi:hypothetical protein
MTEKIESPKTDLTESKIIFRGPFPWPILLGTTLPFAIISILIWTWHLEDYVLFLRTAWVLLCSIVPGLYLMITIGSVTQFRKRPILSSISLLLGFAVLIFCAWGIQKIVITSATLL